MSNDKATGKIIYNLLEAYFGDLKIVSDKDFYKILNENKELKQNNLLLIDKKEELERKLKMLLLKLKDDEKSLNYRENIFENEFKVFELRQKVKQLEKENELIKGKFKFLESINSKNLIFDDAIKNISEREILSYLNDMVIKNVDKKHTIKEKNKKILADLIFIIKEYKSKTER